MKKENIILHTPLSKNDQHIAQTVQNAFDAIKESELEIAYKNASFDNERLAEIEDWKVLDF